MKVPNGIEYVGRGRGYVLLLCETFGKDALNVLMLECSPNEIAQINQALSTLPERDRRYLEARFGLEDGNIRSLRRAGQIIGLNNNSRAGQIEKRALYALRHPSRKSKITFLLPLGRETAGKGAKNSVLDIPVQEVGFSARPLNVFKRAGIQTLGDIAARGRKEVNILIGIGGKTIVEIEEILKGHGLSFAPNPDQILTEGK